MDTKTLYKKALELKVSALKMVHEAGSGCSGAVASSMEILTALYYGQLSDGRVMNYDHRKPGWSGQDYFVLSKFIAAPALYSILCDVGFFGPVELDSYRKIDGLLQAVPTVKIPGVSASVPGVGQGLSVAVGLGLALKREREKNRVFGLFEDRELQSGQFWEAAMSAAHYKIDNLIGFLECSGFQKDGNIRSVMNVEPVVEKLESFGWRVFKVNNGHDLDELLDVLYRAIHMARKPKMIICKTTLGKGIPFAEGKSYYYDVPLSEPEMKEFLNFSERQWRSFTDFKAHQI